MLPPEVFHHYPAAMARLVYGQMLKLIACGAEDLTHKRGRLIPAWKGKGPLQDCSSCRSLLISSHMSKVVHRSVRQVQAVFFEDYLQSQQIGGRRKLPVNLAVHMCRSFHRFHASAKRSTGLIFLDLKEAFYRVVRELSLGGHLTDHHILRLADRFGIGPADMSDFRQFLRQPSAIAGADLPAHLQLSFQALHTDTHFQVPAQRNWTRTSLGSRPGDCFADTVFSYLWAKILKQLEQILHSQQLLDVYPATDLESVLMGRASNQPDPPLVFMGPTWMDDLAVRLSATDAQQIERKASVACGILLDQCKKYFMEPNLQAGKTEIMFSFRGQHSRGQRAKHYGGSASGTIPVLCEDMVASVRIVPRYVHLGGLLHHQGQSQQEMRRRLGIAHQPFTQHRKHLYSNKALTWEQRLQLFQTVVVSQLSYNLESWVLDDSRTQQAWEHGVCKLYRRLQGIAPDTHMTHREVWIQANLPSPDTLLRRARLRYFGTLANCGYKQVWTVLSQDAAWWQQLLQDLSWMWRWICNTSRLPDPSLEIAPWCQLVTAHRSYWKKLVNRAVATELAYHGRMLATEKFHQRLCSRIQAVGFVQKQYQLETPPEEPDTPKIFACIGCKQVCKSKAGLGAHMAKKHGYVNPVRRLFDSTHCPSCLREYHSHYKVQRHLMHSAQCRGDLQTRRMHCTPAPGRGSQTEHAQLQRHDGLAPVLTGQGPSLDPQPAHAESIFHLELDAVLAEVLLETTQDTLLSAEAEIRDRIQHMPITWEDFCVTLACQYSVSMANLDRALQKAPGANVNARNKDGNSPLMLACILAVRRSSGQNWTASQYLPFINKLLDWCYRQENKAEVNVESGWGFTPLDKVTEILKEAEEARKQEIRNQEETPHAQGSRLWERREIMEGRSTVGYGYGTAEEQPVRPIPRESPGYLEQLEPWITTEAVLPPLAPGKECKKLLEAQGAKNGEAPFNPAYLTTEAIRGLSLMGF
eukprot:Skav228857  [mRNA]  locus=scaffold1718:297876:313905:- [translate_table: standard]